MSTFDPFFHLPDQYSRIGRLSTSNRVSWDPGSPSSSGSGADEVDKRKTCHHACRCQCHRRGTPARLRLHDPGNGRTDEESAGIGKHVQTERQSQAVRVSELMRMFRSELGGRGREIRHAVRCNPHQPETWLRRGNGFSPRSSSAIEKG